MKKSFITLRRWFGPHEKSQEAIDILRNIGTDTPRVGPIVLLGRSVQPSVKLLKNKNKKKNVRTHLTEFSGSKHGPF